MDHFHYRDGQLYCEDVPVADLAERFGTPLYVYSQAAILGTLKALQTAFAEVDPLVCYSVKANSNLGDPQGPGRARQRVRRGLRRRAATGCGQAGGDPGKTVFAGVGKTDEEIRAGLEAGVLMFNVESEAELDAIARVAAGEGQGRADRLAGQPRRRPQDAPLHLDGQEGVEVRHGHRPLAGRWPRRSRRMPSVSMIGMHMHIGSQITTAEPYAGAVAKGVEIIAPAARDGPPDRLVQHGRRLRDRLPGRRGAADRRVRPRRSCRA